MRCPRCESSNGEDFFQNTVRQSRNVGGANILDGGLGSFEFDSQFWTCKKCMVRCISDEQFDEQKWQASLLNMTPEERKSEIKRETARRWERDRKAKIERDEAAKQEIKEMTFSEWGEVFGGLLVIAGVVYIVIKFV